MANTLRFKRGLAAGIPTGVAGEPLFTTDTFDLYIGNGTTNTRFQKYIASGTTSQYLRGDGSLATFPSLTGFVPYTGATANVDLGTHTILAQNATIASSGSGDTATINHSSGSGIALNITKGGNNEGLYINKTGGSGNAATIIGTLNATALVKSGGLSTEYLKADGSVSTLTNPITGTAASGQVSYWSGTSTQAGSNNLFWDSANSRLGIGTTTPTEKLQIVGGFTASANSFLSAGNLSIFTANTPRRLNIQVGNGGIAGAIGIYEGGGTLNTIIGLDTPTSADLQIAAAQGIRFYTGSTLGNVVTMPTNERMRLYGATGNLAIGGTFTDSGQRLQVTGDTLMKGSGNTTGTTALTVQNSDGTNIFIVRNNGSIFANSGISVGAIGTGAGMFPSGTSGQETITLRSSAFPSETNNIDIFLTNGQGDAAHTSGTRNLVDIFRGFNPTSGTGVYNLLRIRTTINQTGGANGITRGLYVNPSLTAAADWRSIEWSNNTGWGLYGAGTAQNYLGGNTAIGNTTITSRTNLTVWKNITGDTTAFGIYSRGTIQSGVTTEANMFVSVSETAAASFTLGALKHFRALNAGFGAGSVVTNQFGFIAEAELTGATNNYGFYGNIASGTGRWNFYANGTALNYMNGALLLGSTTDSGEKLQVNGTAKITDSATFTKTYTNSSDLGIIVTALIPGINLRSNSQGRTSLIQNFNSNATMSIVGGTATNNPSTTIATFNANDGSVNIGGWTTSTGELLQVQGTAKITGASSFGADLTYTRNTNLINTINVINTANGTDAQSRLYLQGGSGAIILGQRSNLTTDYKILGINDGYLFKSGVGDIAILNDASTGNIKFAAGGSSTAQLTLNASGNLGLGVTPSAWSGLRALQVGATASLSGFTPTGEGAYLSSNAFFNGSSWIYQTTATSSQYVQVGGQHRWFQANSGTAGNAITFTESMRLFTTNNLAIGSTTDSGEKLQVTGTAKITGASSFGGNMTLSLNQNAATFATISNTTSGTASSASLGLVSNNTSGGLYIGKNSTLTTAFKIASQNDAFIINSAGGDLSILNDNGFGNIKFGAGGSSTAQMTLTTVGRLILGAGDSGELLQVAGTAKITGATYLGSTLRIGYDVAQAVGGAVRNIQISGTNSTNAAVAIIRNSNDTASASITFGKTRATTNGGTTIAQNGDNIGGIAFSYSDGTGLQSASALIAGQVDGTPSAANVPGRLVFYTVPSGLSSVERMRISANGNVAIDTNTLFVDAAANSVAVGTVTINASAKLQIDSTTQGFLPPRMTAAQRAAIASPVEGLIVFQSDGVVGLYLYVNSAWKSLAIVN
jgi:hypothetical protein